MLDPVQTADRPNASKRLSERMRRLAKRPRNRYRARDSQQSKVYKAEGIAFTGHRNKAELRSATHCEVWVNRVLASKRVQNALAKVPHYRPSRVRVEAQWAGASAHQRGDTLRISPSLRTEWVVLHELAHAMTPAKSAAGHGQEWAAIYLALVRGALGKAAYDRLRNAFKAERVRFKPKRTLSPERKAALVERLARIRPVKPNTISHAPSRSLSIAIAIANLDTSYT